ncbi:hypothetical protein [Pelagicoccus mobilis]|uniref:hypothetical protein n=1 Tax=Pelagicoccus mobilis TaxID=415221 RepID=UPI0019036191|nr:hypothetical protein [Pelagicoccus mobilis]
MTTSTIDITYVCLPLSSNDGRSIYDKRLTEALNELGIRVNTLELAHPCRRFIPIWGKKWQKMQVEYVKKTSQKSKFTIVSHELLADFSRTLKPDLFIIHNLFSHFSFKSRPDIQLFYRCGSSHLFNSVAASSQRLLFLSERERAIASETWPDLPIYASPPGIPQKENLPLNYNATSIKTLGSNDWLPKRASKLSRSDHKYLKNAKLEVISDNFGNPSPAIIEDKFLSGFKLKLMEHLYNGDTIASFSDLSSEIDWINPHYSRFKHVNSINEAISFFNKTEASIGATNEDRITKSRLDLTSRFAWKEVARNIASKLDH